MTRLFPSLLALWWSISLSAASSVYGVTSLTDGIDGATFDYIVIGGGLAGLTLASRLSEDPSVTVLVVEAGNDDRNNPMVFDIYNSGEAAGGPFDWQYPAESGHIIDA